jgi:hypothetical protein
MARPARLEQITIALPPELRAFVSGVAERESRTVAGQIRHFVAEAARRNGATDHGQQEGWKVERLTPLPVIENLIGNPAALARAKQSLPGMNKNSDAYLLLSRQVEQAENFMQGTPLFDEYQALLNRSSTP